MIPGVVARPAHAQVRGLQPTLWHRGHTMSAQRRTHRRPQSAVRLSRLPKSPTTERPHTFRGIRRIHAGTTDSRARVVCRRLGLKLQVQSPYECRFTQAGAGMTHLWLCRWGRWRARCTLSILIARSLLSKAPTVRCRNSHGIWAMRPGCR